MNIGGPKKEREKLGSRASVHKRKSITSPQIQSFSRGKDECESEIINFLLVKDDPIPRSNKRHKHGGTLSCFSI